MRLDKRIEINKCEWLKNYLKSLLKNKDIKKYNRTKILVYYFPSILHGISSNDFETAMEYADETYIYLRNEDPRCKIFDKVYEKVNGREFVPNSWDETRYISIDDVFKHFNL